MAVHVYVQVISLWALSPRNIWRNEIFFVDGDIVQNWM